MFKYYPLQYAENHTKVKSWQEEKDIQRKGRPVLSHLRGIILRIKALMGC